MSQDETEKSPEHLGIEARDWGNLVPGARSYFESAVREYAEALLSEAKGIEEMEHIGPGPPEITAGHVEEGKWVLARRRRARSAVTGWVVVARIVQALMSGAIGIGASNFTRTWGAAMCVAGVLLGAVMLLVERELRRENV